MTGFSFMTHVVLECVHAVLLAGLLLFLLRMGKGKLQAPHRGWNWIIGGFSLLLFASILDITDNFNSLNRYVVIGDTAAQAFLEEFVGYFGGFLALAIGLVRWIPGVKELAGEITEGRRAEVVLRESEERFRVFAATASDSFWEMDQNLRFTSTIDYPGSKISPGPGHFIGHTRWEAAGADIDNDEKWRRHREDHLARRPYRNFDFSLTGDDGVTRHLSVSGNPVFASNGAFKGYRGSATDITERTNTEHELLKAYEGLEARIERRTRDLRQEIAERKRAEEALRQSEQHLKLSLDAGQIGTFSWNVQDGTHFWDVRMHEIWGLEQGTYQGSMETDFLASIHPEDIERVKEAIGLTLEEDVEYDIEYRIILPDKDICHVHALAALLRDDQGQPLRLIGICLDITEHKREEGALRAARDQADAANLAKSEFLSSMSHELRTPLNAILGFGQLLEQNPKDPLTDSQLEHTRQILKGGRHLLELINEVLELARIEAGKINLAKVNVRPGKIFAECLDLTRTMADETGIELKDCTGDANLPMVRCDPIRFKQVLINLLSNAVKYNREGGGVILACRETDGGMLRIEVIDTGPGIPAERQGELFQPFCRLGKETSDVEGTGIGLTITKQLVHQMEGRLDVESELGKGSTFWFELPLAGEPVSGTGADEAHKPPPAARDYRFLDRPLNLLYVEDNRANQHLMEALFARYPNVNLFCAQTAEDGLKIAAANRPDMIIMDINLPGLNGIEALGELRRSKKTRVIPVIALSAGAMPREVKKGLEAGFLSYLTKPIVIDEVLNAIDDALVDA